MRKILYFLPFLFLGCSTSNTKKADDKSVTAVKTAYQVQQKSVSGTLEYLASDELQGRDSGSEGIEKAAQFLEKMLKDNNIKPYFKTYRDTLGNFDKPAYNIVGVIEGNDPKLKKEYVIIGAHYDHIGLAQKAINGDNIANGANDNASGTTVASEVAKYFAKNKTNKRSLLIVFFSAEEKGLLGSYHLAKKLKAQNFNLYSMLNFEMLGVPMKRDFASYITGFGKSNMAKKINEYTGKNTVGFLPVELQYRLFMASDNYPFFVEFHVPAQTVSTFDFENFEYYHHVFDEFKLMDTAHMAAYAQEIIPAVEGMTNSKEKEIKLN
ncbi:MULTISPECIES: M28 family peptidase [Flavobacterium]|uniref:M28 family peptidase n=1 Tax=Flavobacterium TaxID=237 RepID=UPI00095EE892|nr:MULTISPECIES: M28 family peptidase [Flavobacterium]MBN9285130.1 M28 family peptidase [Flavobacterium sp.]OJV69766.1 MAG: peptidase M28 [Flavobacterium sp. 40-81]